MKRARTSTAIAATALAALAGTLGPAARLAAQNPVDRKAKERFERAEKAVADAKYGAAYKLYKQVARKYPNSAWGKIAALRTQPTAYLGHGNLLSHGEPTNRVDVVIMGDGYGLDDQNEFEDVAKSVVDVFARSKVLGEYHTYHNFVRLHLTSKDQGVSGFGRKKDTAIGGHIAGKVQGQVGVDSRRAQKWLDQLDHHDGYAIAIVKAGSSGTGGGGIAAVGGRADGIVVHEWGHAFGGLSDEYSTFTGHRGSPRNTVNVSTTEDLKRVPWRHFVEAKYPGVGAYRGADGRIKGAWKPTSGQCRMASGGQFCPVCRERMVLQIYRRVDPIDDQKPAPIMNPKHAQRLAGGATLEVTVLEPKSHKLDVRWHVLPQNAAIRATSPARVRDRRKRGKLQPINGKGQAGKYSGRGRYRFRVSAADFQPGYYQVVCRVRDDSKPSGQSRPWVLKDNRALLQSERVWWVEVPPR
ncbi:MAG: M64 family metallopeptidase [bacterium]|nr:M64 family metallopeptidase [bacterium]